MNNQTVTLAMEAIEIIRDTHAVYPNQVADLVPEQQRALADLVESCQSHHTRPRAGRKPLGTRADRNRRYREKKKAELK